jgi:glycosyltransferase involved in cell wall biosynthesis
MRVCIIAEGSYPIIRGGLSEWAHMLIKALKDVTFDIYCITPTEESKWKPVYEKFPNVDRVIIKPLIRTKAGAKTNNAPQKVSSALVKLMENVMNGESADFEKIVRLQGLTSVGKEWLTSKDYWDFVVNTYYKNYQKGSFAEYFWTFNGLNSILLDSLQFIQEIPQADVYHSLSSGFAGYAGSIAKTVRHSPLVISEQGLYLVERYDELSRQNVSEWYRAQLIKFSESLVKTSYKYADKIVPPCHSHMNIEKQLGADPDKIIMIKNGIETDRFVPLPGKNGHRPLVGCFARVVPIKGITTLIKAAKIVCDKFPADFVVVGEIQDEAYYDECKTMVEKFGIADRFKFIGHADAVEWYHKVDVFTLSSNSEGVPYALLEAMSCGLPCVCTDVGGISEILAGGLGYVVPAGQPEQLAQEIYKLLENKELRIEMGQRATAVAREKYTIREEAENILNLYKGLVK